ncbi:hypothetical protein Celaphus_00017309, partial [Cervus elaphus hippelaphus]
VGPSSSLDSWCHQKKSVSQVLRQKKILKKTHTGHELIVLKMKVKLSLITESKKAILCWRNYRWNAGRLHLPCVTEKSTCVSSQSAFVLRVPPWIQSLSR